MGNKELHHSFSPTITEEINRESFEYISIIGKGGFGKVWRVKLKKYNKEFAMKEMSKLKIIDKKSTASILSERDFLSKMSHPFIINMYFSFQDKDNLYLVMNLLLGGDLRYHICIKRIFSEDQAKFFISCIILGLEFFHTNGIIHRDIKPENLILDENGYMKITDLGIAKKKENIDNNDTSGTPGYMAPEVMCGQKHSYVADYFALGIIGYELMNGRRPYLGKSRKEIKNKIMAKQILIKKENVPEGWTLEAADCINKLIQRKPRLRLGYNGIKDIKNHIWFKGFPWKELYNKKLVSTFIPPNQDNFDYHYCNKTDIISQNTEDRYKKILANESYQNSFDNYLYYNAFNKNTFNVNDNFKNPHIIYEDCFFKKNNVNINLDKVIKENNLNLDVDNLISRLDSGSLGNDMTVTGSTKKNSDVIN